MVLINYSETSKCLGFHLFQLSGQMVLSLTVELSSQIVLIIYFSLHTCNAFFRCIYWQKLGKYKNVRLITPTSTYIQKCKLILIVKHTDVKYCARALGTTM